MAEESKRDLTSQSMKFDKIQIKLASPEDILECLTVRLQSRRQSTTEL